MPLGPSNGARSAALLVCVLAVCNFAWAMAPAIPSVAPATAVAPDERWIHLADTVFQHYTSDQGFPNGSVTAIAQDGDGFLWVGTQGGLLRWDGYHVRRYTADPTSAGQLRDNLIQALRVDAAGRLWIGTSTAGLARYDRLADNFVSYPVGDDGLSDVSVKSIVDDGAGGVWIATSGGVDHLQADGSFEHIRHSPSDPASLPDNQVAGLLRDRLGGLWMGTSAGLVRRDPDTGALVRVPLIENSDKQPNVESMLQDSSGKLWIGTGTAGAFIYDPTTKVARQLHESSGESHLQVDDVYQIAEAAPGLIWLGTFGGGIVAVDTTTFKTHRIRHDPLIPTSLGSNTIWALYRDRSGLMWTGTGAGLGHADPGQQAFLTVFGAEGRQRGLSDAGVISVLPVSSNRIWLGLGGNGIDIIDPSGTASGPVAQLRPNPLKPETALPRDNVLALAGVDDIYVGSLRGLYRADAAARGVVLIDVPEFKSGDSADALAYADGSLWLGNWSGALWHLQAKPGSTTLPLIAKSTATFTDTRVLTLARGPDHGWWVGTGNGLTRLNAKLDVIERIVPDAADPMALIGGYVTSLLTDDKGRLWAGTLAGISVLDHRDARGRARFRSFGAEAGLSNISMLLKDASGNIWASSNSGLVMVDRDSFAIRKFGRADGVAISNYWTGSGAATTQGELLFGGVGGLTVVRPQRFKAWTYRVPLVVTEARVGGKSVPTAPFNGNTSDSTRSLIVAPEANSLLVEFSALDLSAPEKNRYAYRLEGYDTQWIETDSTRRFASYTNLPPGDYQLRLRGSNRNGEWSERLLTVPIRVLPTWYQTIWFRLLLALASIALVYVIVLARTALLRRRQRELERSVTERTLQLQEATKALEAKSIALEEASLTDALTGLRNRRFLAQHIETDTTLAIRRHEASLAHPERPFDDAPLVFYLIDIDHFKQVNDSHGHAAGDAVLVQLCERLRSVFRESDDLVRWGGEEFLIVSRGATRATATELAERVRHAVAEREFVLADGQLLRKTCSIGFVCFPFIARQPRALGWEETVELADIALYSAKQGGRDCWVGFRENIDAVSSDFVARFKSHPDEFTDSGQIEVLSNRSPAPAVKSG
jgi:diguanylate cyclase (GGDEF)-like protein